MLFSKLVCRKGFNLILFWYEIRHLPGWAPRNLIRTSIFDTYAGPIKITTRLDHINRCETASGTSWSNGWICQDFFINTRRDWIGCTEPESWLNVESERPLRGPRIHPYIETLHQKVWTLNPEPQTPNLTPHTPHPTPHTPHPTPHTPLPKPQTPNPKPLTPNPKPKTQNAKAGPLYKAVSEAVGLRKLVMFKGMASPLPPTGT